MTFGQEYSDSSTCDSEYRYGSYRPEVDYNGQNRSDAILEKPYCLTRMIWVKIMKAKLPSVAASVVSKTVKNVTTTYTTTVATMQLIKKQVSQGVSYTTGVPAMIGAMMFFKGNGRDRVYGMWKNLIRIRS